ncbi:unnamed protein product [Notodromas monacha]|uniref:Secreted protein n=1 Tax=Notodromas monacha TaxID=399045 RepID=A0A7R9GK89_9CRUS|nr:unnamed protein product [Notodromas monacha]CAG0924371.1 unnamed protein product [Notodromas monacha]
MFLVSRLSRGRNGLLISIVLLAFLLGFLSSNCVDAARSKKSSGAEEQCDGDSCGSDSDPRPGMRGRRVTRKAAATRRSARRFVANRRRSSVTGTRAAATVTRDRACEVDG